MKGTIEQMLKNEKYAGHMSLGKSYTHNGVVIRSTRLDMNESMIKNHHTPFISPEVFEMAMEKRNERAGKINEVYIPQSQRTSPFHLFVYSLSAKKHLYYRVERPKGKYEIPTLFIYDKNREYREMITVNNLYALLKKL